MIDDLRSANRLLLRAELRPLVGSTFQPTGFPDLGAAEFQRPGSEGRTDLLVESVQSMANHMESLGWDGPDHGPVETLTRLPYVEVVEDGGGFLTSSRLEPHRLASAYIKEAQIEGEKGTDWLTQRLGLQQHRPTDWHAVYSALFELDPLCLLHGVFFSDPAWSDMGNPKVRRAITAVVEAHGAQRVVSGGLKRDDVQFSHASEGRGAEEGYGFVPFGRTEYTAERIELSAAIDLSQIRGYGLSEDRTELLTLIALWELATLLDEPLRLRTACDLETTQLSVSRPADYDLPEPGALAERITSLDPGTERANPFTATWSD
ncbi:MAG: type I-G CRISPR-associated RAMP protein Csb1/Cas7g [Solirubrobacterales bacterium]